MNHRHILVRFGPVVNSFADSVGLCFVVLLIEVWCPYKPVAAEKADGSVTTATLNNPYVAVPDAADLNLGRCKSPPYLFLIFPNAITTTLTKSTAGISNTSGCAMRNSTSKATAMQVTRPPRMPAAISASMR